MTGTTGTPSGRRGAQQRQSVVVTPVPEPAAAPPPEPARVVQEAAPSHAAAPSPAPAAAAPSPSHVAPATVAPVGPSFTRDNQQLTFGLIVVVAGFVAILIALWLVVINYHVAADATSILGIITTAIAGLGGAFFGVAVGQQGTASANKERAAAEASKEAAYKQTLRFAAHMDPSVAKRLVD